MEASKWLKIEALVDTDEMKSLMDALGPFFLYYTSCKTEKDKEKLEKELFLQVYDDYVSCLKRGEYPNEKAIQHPFSTVWSLTRDHFRFLSLDENMQIAQVIKPSLQLRHHSLGYSPIEGKFRSMIRGEGSIDWGVQFSYPQLFQDTSVYQVQKVTGDDFPNTALFTVLRKWIRENTLPTPFIVNEQEIRVPSRLGKKAFGWINNHVELVKKQIKVKA